MPLTPEKSFTCRFAMDVMKPMLVWVEDVCFRFPDSEIWRSPKDNNTFPELIQIGPMKCDNVKETIQQDIINPDVNGAYNSSLYIAQRYHPFIIGHQRITLGRIEKETKTMIFMPKKFETHDCVIRGSNSAVINDAIDRINRKIEYARSIIDPTHFLSVSMTDETIKSNFVKFKDSVLNETNSNAGGIYELDFEKPEKLHLNLGMLLLVDEYELKAALEALAEWKETMITPFIEKHGPIKIKVQGLDYAHEVNSSTSVVYAKVSFENDALQAFADKTEQLFVQKGLMIAPKNRMKLHMKLMRFRSVMDRRISRTNAEKSCRDFVTTHRDHFFGETMLNSFSLSQRHTYDENQYYATVEKIDLQVE